MSHRLFSSAELLTSTRYTTKFSSYCNSLPSSQYVLRTTTDKIAILWTYLAGLNTILGNVLGGSSRKRLVALSLHFSRYWREWGWWTLIKIKIIYRFLHLSIMFSSVCSISEIGLSSLSLHVAHCLECNDKIKIEFWPVLWRQDLIQRYSWSILKLIG